MDLYVATPAGQSTVQIGADGTVGCLRRTVSDLEGFDNGLFDMLAQSRHSDGVIPLGSDEDKLSELELSSGDVVHVVRSRKAQARHRLRQLGYCPDAYPEALRAACAAGGDPPRVALLLDAGADPDARDASGFTAVHISARDGSVKCLRALHAAGAALNIRNDDGLQPLHVAASKGSAQVLRELVMRGVPVDEPSRKGLQAIHYAALYGKTDCLVAAVESGSKVDAADAAGLTAVHHAAVKGRMAPLRQLRTLGASHSLLDKSGRAPLYYAKAHNHAAAVSFLKEWGRRPCFCM